MFARLEILPQDSRVRRARRAKRGGNPTCSRRAFLADSRQSHASQSMDAGGLFQHSVSRRPCWPSRLVPTQAALQGLEIFDTIASLLVGQPQGEVLVVMVDHSVEGREAPVVVEATFLMCEEPFNRRRPVALVGRTIGLKIVDSNLGRRVHVPTRLREQRGDVTRRARPRTIEHELAARRRRAIETSLGGNRRRDRQLIEVECGELRGDQIPGTAHLAEPRLAASGYWAAFLRRGS